MWAEDVILAGDPRLIMDRNVISSRGSDLTADVAEPRARAVLAVICVRITKQQLVPFTEGMVEPEAAYVLSLLHRERSARAGEQIVSHSVDRERLGG
jgi:hypothetical protein